eukprot:GHVU01086544.1.p2 GENE.GHVU01086544.1~~GHVU01086544.1.p2  ORF type:complete len:101 (-),score=9.75 GHVU01086544.1:109-411(-)
MLPSSHLSIAAQQRRWGAGLGGRGGGQTAAVGHRRSEWGMEAGAKEDHRHTHTYADSPQHAQSVPLAVAPLPLVPDGIIIRPSEDTRRYTHSVATQTHTH